MEHIQETKEEKDLTLIVINTLMAIISLCVAGGLGFLVYALINIFII